MCICAANSWDSMLMKDSEEPFLPDRWHVCSCSCDVSGRGIGGWYRHGIILVRHYVSTTPIYWDTAVLWVNLNLFRSHSLSRFQSVSLSTMFWYPLCSYFDSYDPISSQFCQISRHESYRDICKIVTCSDNFFKPNNYMYLHKAYSAYSAPSQCLHKGRLDILMPIQNGRHFPHDIFKCIFLNESVWISVKTSLKFISMGPVSGMGTINNIQALVQIMAWRQAFVWTNDG